MGANRSRTERWRDCLEQLQQRDGALEIAIASATPGGGDLIWRVRVVSVSDREIVVEQPSAMGQAIELGSGIDLVAAMTIGQNRWMFRTRTIAPVVPPAGGRPVRALRLAMPDTVERCQRRNFYRVSTAELALPSVECWPIVEPSTIAAAELANQAQIGAGGRGGSTEADQFVLPEVGPRFTARLVNIGGGGAGLVVDRNDAAAVDRTRLLWLRVHLTPQIPVPLAMTGRLAHTHMDSAQNMYAGVAFEFAFHPSHRQFVVAQIARYVSLLQQGQSGLRRSA